MNLGTRLIAGSIFLAIACVFGAIGVLVFRKSYKRKSHGKAAQGIVVGYETRRHSDGYIYYPEIRFETEAGSEVVFVATTGSSGPPRKGRKVKVIYCPEYPEDADLGSIGDLFFVPLVCMLFGVGFLLCSILIYWGLDEQ